MSPAFRGRNRPVNELLTIICRNGVSGARFQGHPSGSAPPPQSRPLQERSVACPWEDGANGSGGGEGKCPATVTQLKSGLVEDRCVHAAGIFQMAF